MASSGSLEQAHSAAEHRWDLTDLFGSPKEAAEALNNLEARSRSVVSFAGSLGRSASELKAALDARFGLARDFGRVASYGSRWHDQDMRNADGQEFFQRVNQAATEIDSALSFFEPELLEIPVQTLETWLASGELYEYEVWIRNVTRRRCHTRSREVEEVLACAGNIAGAPYDTYQLFSTVDIPYPVVKLSDGAEVRLSPPVYASLRARPEPDDRKLVFSQFWKTISGYQNTLASLLASKLFTDRFYARTRGYSTDLEASLDATQVPTAIYHNMVAQIRKALPILWRYLEQKRKHSGLDVLGYEDLYVPIGTEINRTYEYRDACDLMVNALEPLGTDYVATLKRGLAERWTDVYPSQGKRTGAYSSGEAYGTHPFVLLNYTNDLSSVSTLAHEFGHAMHSYLSNATQPYARCHYPIFVAEVASTVNEHLLRLHMQDNSDTEELSRYLAGQALEGFRTTVFRQAMFAEFELTIHGLVETGQPVTSHTLNELYGRLLREYYGHEHGVVHIDPAYHVEWAYIPHFYYNFYMFQYTTSFIAATALAAELKQGNKVVAQGYERMLRSGGSLAPTELLGLTGVDLMQDEVWSRAFGVMSSLIDQL